MDRNAIVAALDTEIVRLQQVRAIVCTTLGIGARERSSPSASATSAKRRLSPEARKRIADAQKKRWAAVKRKQAAVGASSAVKPAGAVHKRRAAKKTTAAR